MCRQLDLAVDTALKERLAGLKISAAVLVCIGLGESVKPGPVYKCTRLIILLLLLIDDQVGEKCPITRPCHRLD